MGIAAKIAIGEIECGIGMGSDTTSDAPIVVSRKLSQRLVQAQQAKSFGQKVSAFKGFSPGELRRSRRPWRSRARVCRWVSIPS